MKIAKLILIKYDHNWLETIWKRINFIILLLTYIHCYQHSLVLSHTDTQNSTIIHINFKKSSIYRRIHKKPKIHNTLNIITMISNDVKKRKDYPAKRSTFRTTTFSYTKDVCLFSLLDFQWTMSNRCHGYKWRTNSSPLSRVHLAGKLGWPSLR